MPTRAGQPTAQETLAQQQAGQGTATPIVTGQGVHPAVATALALAATTAATAAVGAAPPTTVSLAASKAITTAAAGILGAFDRFLAGRRAEQEPHVHDLLSSEAPELTDAQRLEVVAAETEAEKLFAAGVRARLDRDLPPAMAIADRQDRDARVRAILAREKRYLEMREAAVADRALGTAEQRQVQQESPEGGYWQLSPQVKLHTPDCVAMAGKVWPHSVLASYHPPLHFGCDCRVRPIEWARERGLIAPDSFASVDDAMLARQVTETPDLDELLEATVERWWKGTAGPGRFRARHGDLAAGLRRPRAPRIDPEPVRTLGDELDVRPVAVAELKAGDRLMVDGALTRIEAVVAPGVLELAGGETVRVTRDTVQGVVDAEGAPMPAPAEIPGRPDRTPDAPVGGSEETSTDPPESTGDSADGTLDVPADEATGAGAE
jgi:hypothetical protein